MSSTDTTGSAACAVVAEKDVLETPVLDSERPNLLQRITEEGGYAYVRMAMLASGGDMRAAEAAKEMAWEQLHSGPWNSVVPVWRDAYAMACLHVAKLHYAAGEFSLALRALDMGLIMGGLSLRDDLNSVIKTASKRARLTIATSKLENEDDGKDDEKSKLFVSEEVDVAEVRFVFVTLVFLLLIWFSLMEIAVCCGDVQLIKHRVQSSLI